MVNFKEMVQGQVFYDVCEFYWKDVLTFQEILPNGLIKATHNGISSIIEKGTPTYLNPSDAEHCFISSKEANEYQRERAEKISAMNKTIENSDYEHREIIDELYHRYKKLAYKR